MGAEDGNRSEHGDELVDDDKSEHGGGSGEDATPKKKEDNGSEGVRLLCGVTVVALGVP